VGREQYGTHADNVFAAIAGGLTPRYAITSCTDEWDRFEGLYATAVERYVAAHRRPRRARDEGAHHAVAGDRASSAMQPVCYRVFERVPAPFAPGNESARSSRSFRSARRRPDAPSQAQTIDPHGALCAAVSRGRM
jgi:hypothetical protein